MERKIYAEITLDEDVMFKNMEENGIEDQGDISYLEHEFGWLEKSGFNLENAMISDEDDTSEWGRYIDYVMEWGMSHSCEDCSGDKIMNFDEWKKAGSVKYQKKIALISPISGAVSLVHSLGGGEPTQNGDRTSGYINIATVPGRTKYVKASLIEEKAGLKESEQGYALHIINDVDMTDCRLMRTVGFDMQDLIDLLETILDAMESGEM